MSEGEAQQGVPRGLFAVVNAEPSTKPIGESIRAMIDAVKNGPNFPPTAYISGSLMEAAKAGDIEAQRQVNFQAQMQGVRAPFEVSER